MKNTLGKIIEYTLWIVAICLLILIAVPFLFVVLAFVLVMIVLAFPFYIIKGDPIIMIKRY